MGYSLGAVEMLGSWLKHRVPVGSAILDIGDQQLSESVPERSIYNLLLTAGHSGEAADGILQSHFMPAARRRMADVFQGSRYTYHCVDLFPGEQVIVADLNSYRVPEEWRERFDVTTNFGTTEHILDQVNAFRAMHDFAKPGALMYHSVPCLGYFNHALYNYHPAFFLFLAEANEYEVEALNISAPHLEHTLPESEALPSAAAWRGRVLSSGIIGVALRKTRSAAFQLFTDHDATRTEGSRRLPEKWLAFLNDRYDLRVRT